MVTGRVPFEGDTPFKIGMKHKGEIPQNPKEINSLLPDDLNNIILKCLEKDKLKRFQDAEGLKSALNKAREITKEITINPEWENSIAVLPFVDLSPQKDQEYFCDGMSEELINSLSNIKNLKVVARTSAFSFKGKETDIRNIGKQLDVATVLEGSIRKAGNKLRITAQLINVADGYHLWSEKYDRELDDVFAIQDEVALAIVDKLKLKLFGDEKDRLTKHHTDDLGAYDLYSKGRFFWNWRTEKGIKKAIEYFKQAINKDPRYALAYVGLSDSYVIMPEYASIAPLDAYPKAKEAVSKALEIDNTLAEAHASLAAYKMFHDFDWDGANDEFKKAIDLNPSYAISYYWNGICAVSNARFDEAIDLIKHGMELDPVSLVMHGGLGWVFCIAGRYDEAIRISLKTSEMNPEFGILHYVLGLAYYHKEMYQEALEQFQKEKKSLSAYIFLAEAWAEITARKIGKQGQAKQALSDLIKKSAKSYVSHYYLACLSLAIGEIDGSFKWLEMAYDHRDFWLLFVKIDPLFNDVKSDPRFKALLKKMNLD
jgi:TolB-like protein/Tfp pilus assembly protein PilF